MFNSGIIQGESKVFNTSEEWVISELRKTVSYKKGLLLLRVTPPPPQSWKESGTDWQ